MKQVANKDVFSAMGKTIAMIEILKSEITDFRQLSRLAHELREMNAGCLPEVLEIIEEANPDHQKLLKKLLDIEGNAPEVVTAHAV